MNKQIGKLAPGAKNIWLIVAVVLTVSIVVSGGIYGWQKTKQKPEQLDINSMPISTSSNEPTDRKIYRIEEHGTPLNWKVLRNEKLSFEIWYPSEIKRFDYMQEVKYYNTVRENTDIPAFDLARFVPEYDPTLEKQIIFYIKNPPEVSPEHDYNDGFIFISRHDNVNNLATEDFCAALQDPSCPLPAGIPDSDVPIRTKTEEIIFNGHPALYFESDGLGGPSKTWLIGAGKYIFRIEFRNVWVGNEDPESQQMIIIAEKMVSTFKPLR